MTIQLLLWILLIRVGTGQVNGSVTLYYMFSKEEAALFNTRMDCIDKAMQHFVAFYIHALLTAAAFVVTEW